MSIYENTYPVHRFLCDSRGNLRPSNLLGYMTELGYDHVEEQSSKGYDMKEDGFWVLYTWQVHFLRPVKMDTKLRLRTWVSNVRGFFSTRQMDGWDEEGNMVFFSTSRWLYLSKEKRRPMRIEKDCVDNIGGKSYYNVRPNLPKPDRWDGMERTVRERDIDLNRHMNNAAYLSFAMDCYDLDYFDTHEPQSLEMIFTKESYFGEKLIVSQGDYEGKDYFWIHQGGDLRVQLALEWRER